MMRLIFVALFCFTAEAATYWVSTNGVDTNPGSEAQPFLTIQKGIDTAVGGDTVKVGAGTYNQNPITTKHAVGSPIIVDGQNVANLRSWRYNHTNWLVKNFTFGYNGNQVRVQFERNGSFNIFSNNIVDAGYTNNQILVQWVGPATIPYGTSGSDNLVISNVITRSGGYVNMLINGERNTIQGNTFSDADTCDFLRLYGRSNNIVGNVFTNIFRSGGPGDHPDWLQISGENGFGSEEHVIEKNFIVNLMTSGAQVGQMSAGNNINVRGILIKNNVFANITSQASCVMRDVHWYNNVFYNVGAGSALSFGTTPGFDFESGSSHGCRVANNIFLNCDRFNSDILGWYRFNSTNLTNVYADYNFVARSNYATVRVDPQQREIGNPAGWTAGLWWEPNGINGGNPQLVNEAGFDYHPTAASFLIRAGVQLSSVTDDYEGNPRSSLPTIGAYEYTDGEELLCQVGPKTIRAYSLASTNLIRLVWPTNDYRMKVVIDRRIFTNKPSQWTPWTTVYENTDTNTTTDTFIFSDTNALSGVPYEYRLTSFVTNYDCAAPHGDDPIWYFQHITAGHRVPLRDQDRRVILLVESGMTNALATELDRLRLDLIGDGYKVYRHNIAALNVGEAGWYQSITNTKALIRTNYNTETNALWSIFIIGHVPIPYSGLSSPGGHSENFGAHPADWFYADMNDSSWTDITANNTSGDFTMQHNIPGDGKFDQTQPPTTPEMQVGRVDFRNMPAFALSETELLRQYLNRDHAWRHKQFTVRDIGMVNSNNNSGLIYRGQPPDAHDYQSSMFGSVNSTILGDWLTEAASTNTSFLLAASWGNGFYNVDRQVGHATNFAATPLHVAFTTMYGSYEGDWDSSMLTNAILFAPLASSGYTLGNYYHEGIMNVDGSTFGEPVAYDLYAQLASRNLPTSGLRYFTYAQMPNGTNVAWPRAYQSWLGDPTLRMRVAATPTNVIVGPSGANNVITWDDAADDDIQGYHVYRAPATNLNDFTRLTSVPDTDGVYTDIGASSGSYTYMVRTVKLEDENARSYYNESQGVFAEDGSAPPSPPGPAGSIQIIRAQTARVGTIISP